MKDIEWKISRKYIERKISRERYLKTDIDRNREKILRERNLERHIEKKITKERSREKDTEKKISRERHRGKGTDRYI